MSRNLSDLCDCIRPKAEQLLRKAHEELNWTMVVVDTVRTPEEQQENIRLKVSWTTKSDHLPQPVCGKSHAVDIAPYHLTQKKNWAPDHPDWEILGRMGEGIGLYWGGRWKKRDCPHFGMQVLHERTLMASSITPESWGES